MALNGISPLPRLSASRALSFAGFAAIAVTAWHRFIERLVEAAHTDAARLGWLALAIPVAIGVAALIRRAPAQRPQVAVVGLLLALLVGLRIAAVASVAAPVTSDWLRHHQLAVAIAADGPRFDVVPTGFPMLLAVGYLAFGSEPIVGQVIQIVIATGIGLATYALAALAWDHRVGAVALLLIAIAPSQILIGTVLANEPLYTLLLLCTALLLTWPTVASALATGAVFGLSEYVRATSLALVPLIAVLMWGIHRHARPLRAVAAFSTGFGIVLIPVLVWNLAAIGMPSPSSSRVQNFSLMVGMNQASDGRWTIDDYRLVGAEYGTPRSERIAWRIATERISADPVGVLGLMLRKVWAWGDEAYGSFWAVAVSGSQAAGAVLTILSQAWWAVVATLAALAVGVTSLERRVTQLTIGAVAVIAVLHLILEAQGRYHAYLLPLFAILAAGAIGGAWAGESPAASVSRREVHSGRIR